MKNLSIEGTTKTPTVKFDINEGVLEIKGRSIPENSTEFYKPLLDSLKKFEKPSNGALHVNFQLEYFNTSSSKCILDVLKSIVIIRESGTEVAINWHYEEDDEDMLESGENYQELVKIPFNMVLIAE